MPKQAGSRAVGPVPDRTGLRPHSPTNLAYDMALIGLARRLEIEFDLNSFDQRQLERNRLERALEARGLGLDRLIELDELTEQSEPC